MPEHHLLAGPHEAVVADRSQRVRLGVGVQPGVQVGPADAAAEDVEDDLSGGGLRVGQLDQLELRILDGDSPHQAPAPGRRLSSNGGSGLIRGASSWPAWAAVSTSAGSSLISACSALTRQHELERGAGRRLDHEIRSCAPVKHGARILAESRVIREQVEIVIVQRGDAGRSRRVGEKDAAFVVEPRVRGFERRAGLIGHAERAVGST